MVGKGSSSAMSWFGSVISVLELLSGYKARISLESNVLYFRVARAGSVLSLILDWLGE